MANKAVKPTDYSKDGYSPQTGTTSKPEAPPQKQGTQSGSQEKKK
jgi:hypothetical protein